MSTILLVVAAVALGVALGRVLASRPDTAAPRQHAPSPTVAPSLAPDADELIGALLRDAVDHLDLGMVIADRSGRVRFRNRSADALRGTHVGVIVDGHVDDALDAARNGTAHEQVVDLHGPPRRSLKLVAEPTPDGGAIVTIEDVSERVRIDTMRTDFVANISHELKTPVGAIAVLAEALVDEEDPEVIRRVGDRLVAEAHRAATTIDDLLELSRIESARIEHEVVDLRAIVASALSRGRAVDDDKGVVVSTFDGDDPLLVRVDRRQMESALGNLVENAVKYSDAGGQVQVRLRVDDRFVEVLVADQGHGIPARDIGRIFERFYRVDRARSRTTGGTGLGLSIVRHVAQNHGGEVLVSSQEGEGSTFVFRFPTTLLVATSDDADHGPWTAPADAPTSTTHDSANNSEINSPSSESTVKETRP